MIRLGIIMPLWDRPEIERPVLDYYRSLTLPSWSQSWGDMAQCHAPSGTVGIEMRRVAIASPSTQPSTAAYARQLGWHVVEGPDTSLGAKLNRGTVLAREILTGADYVMHIGSDDIVTREAITALLTLEAPAAAYDGCYILDTLSWTAGLVRGSGRPCGPGTILSRETMDRLDWTLRDSEADRGMDACLERRLQEIGVEYQVLPMSLDTPIIDIKTSRQLTPMTSYHDMEPIVPARLLERMNRSMRGAVMDIGERHLVERYRQQQQQQQERRHQYQYPRLRGSDR